MAGSDPRPGGLGLAADGLSWLAAGWLGLAAGGLSWLVAGLGLAAGGLSWLVAGLSWLVDGLRLLTAVWPAEEPPASQDRGRAGWPRCGLSGIARSR